MPVLTMRISIIALFRMLATSGYGSYEKYGNDLVARGQSARDFSPAPCRDLIWQQ
ncbi:MAG: hypothetical protein KJN95_08585 [Gammaproteobacteria bacterium]|nr:hypothetical protein [Gammaproteobacteria bacterium]